MSSYKEINTDISYKWKLTKKFQVLSSINYFNFTTRWDKNKDNFTDVTLQNRISAFNKFSYKRKNNRTAQIAFRYYYEDRFGGEMQWQKYFRGTDSVYGESIYTKRWEIIGIYQLPVKEKLMLRFSLNRHNQNSVYGITPYLAIQQISFAQLTWDKHAGRHNMLAGLSLRYTFYDDNTAITARNDGLIKGNHPSHIFLPGLFLQDEIALHSKHTLLAGMRWDQNSMHGTIFSPRVNYKWSPNKHNTLRAGVGNGFRVVNLFSEEHAVYTGARTVEIKETLKPERSWNINLNYTRFHNMKHVFVNIDAGLFYTYFFNRILPDYFSDPNKIIFNNLKGYSVNRGFNVNMDFSFTSALNVSLGFTYTDVFIRSENANGTSIKTRQVQTPPFTGNYSVSYEIKRWLLTIDWNGSVYSPMLLPVLPNDFRPDHSPWYTLMNLQFTKKWNNTLSCYLGFKNLLNFIPS
ncbi:MAG: TonB-dependent receptor, partial [Bacteroidia bacterium]|nr:TonB-dependent receptor [Bacteroidia bacterium]